MTNPMMGDLSQIRSFDGWATDNAIVRNEGVFSLCNLRYSFVMWYEIKCIWPEI